MTKREYLPIGLEWIWCIQQCKITSSADGLDVIKYYPERPPTFIRPDVDYLEYDTVKEQWFVIYLPLVN